MAVMEVTAFVAWRPLQGAFSLWFVLEIHNDMKRLKTLGFFLSFLLEATIVYLIRGAVQWYFALMDWRHAISELDAVARIDDVGGEVWLSCAFECGTKRCVDRAVTKERASDEQDSRRSQGMFKEELVDGSGSLHL